MIAHAHESFLFFISLKIDRVLSVILSKMIAFIHRCFPFTTGAMKSRFSKENEIERKRRRCDRSIAMAKSFESAFSSIVNPFRFLEPTAAHPSRKSSTEEPALEPANISRMNQSRQDPVCLSARSLKTSPVFALHVLRAH